MVAFIVIPYVVLSQSSHKFYRYEVILSDYLSPDSTPQKNGETFRYLLDKGYNSIIVTDSFSIDYATIKNCRIYFEPSGQFHVEDTIVYENTYIDAPPFKIHDITDSVIFRNIEYVKKFPQWFGATNDPSDSVINMLAMKKLNRLIPPDQTEVKTSVTKYGNFTFGSDTYYYCRGDKRIRGRLPYSTDPSSANKQYILINYTSDTAIIWMLSGDKMNGVVDAMFYLVPGRSTPIYNSGDSNIGWHVGRSWIKIE